MSPDNRLKQMKAYLLVAKHSPEGNELYIQDLNLSISHFEKVVSHKIQVGRFSVDNE